jgi:membrane-bound serine protease (ClpP class)
MGSLMLIRPGSNLEFARISRTLIFSTVAVSACFFLFVIGMGLKAQRAKRVSGVDGMMGETGEAIGLLSPAGRVRVHGETWNAVSESGAINAGEKVRVTAVKDLTVYVEHIIR